MNISKNKKKVILFIFSLVPSLPVVPSPPGSEANAEEAPHFKEARLNALGYLEEAIPEANALPPMHLLASLIFSL